MTLPTEIAGLEVVNAQELVEPNSILLFGHPKRGKSTLAGSIRDVPGFERVLHIDLEAGSAPLARQWPDIKVVRPRDFRQVGDVLNALRASENSLGFDCVILDTISTLDKMFQTNWMTEHPSKTGRMEYDGWIALAEFIMGCMWDLHYMYALGISCYHTKIEQNETTKVTWTTPYVQGSARYSVPSVPDMVVYIDINGAGLRTLQMKPKTAMMTGSRYEDVIPENIVGMATMSTLYAAIRGTE